MGKPTTDDPLGQRPDATETFQSALQNMVRHEVRAILRGKTGDKFDGIPDALLAMELIARGWVAYKPSGEMRKV